MPTGSARLPARLARLLRKLPGAALAQGLPAGKLSAPSLGFLSQSPGRGWLQQLQCWLVRDKWSCHSSYWLAMLWHFPSKTQMWHGQRQEHRSGRNIMFVLFPFSSLHLFISMAMVSRTDSFIKKKQWGRRWALCLGWRQIQLVTSGDLRVQMTSGVLPPHQTSVQGDSWGLSQVGGSVRLGTQSTWCLQERVKVWWIRMWFQIPFERTLGQLFL